MIPSEFRHLNKEQLKRRLKIRSYLIYLFAAIGIAAPVVFFMTDYKHNWSWLLIGVTYILLAVENFHTNRRIRAELKKREDRLKKSQDPILQPE